MIANESITETENFINIPAEMKKLNQWVCWRLEERDGKPTKVPMNPRTGGKAQSDNPNTWTGFKEAHAAYMKNKYTGLGFMFSKNNDILGVDIDHCIDTGKLTDKAKEILSTLGSYAELSPSGKGVHILCRGNLPPNGRRKGDLEMYQEGRFFTITGNTIEGYSRNIEERTNELDQIHKKYIAKPEQQPSIRKDTICDLDTTEIISKASSASNGDKFKDLYSGSWAGYTSQSEADLAFCNMLAFWCGCDPVKMDSVFRSSCLYRKKWDTRHGAQTYGQKVIDEAIRGCTETFGDKTNMTSNKQVKPEQEKQPVRKLRTLSFVEILQMEIPPREKMLDPWLLSQSLNMVYAPRGIGKTFFALSLAYAVASGGSFLKWKAEKPSPVLYLDGEMPLISIQERLAQLISMNELEPLEGFLQILNPDSNEGMPDLGSTEGQAEINEIIGEETKLIIVDNISSLVRSGRENESEAWVPVQSWALKHRAAGRSVVFIHHAGKNGSQRGASKREDLLDTVISLKRPSDYQPGEGAKFEVHFEKNRNLSGPDTEPIEATLGADEHGITAWNWRSVEVGNYERIITLANEELTQREIAEELGIHKSNVSRNLKKAIEEGRVKAKKR